MLINRQRRFIESVKNVFFFTDTYAISFSETSHFFFLFLFSEYVKMLKRGYIKKRSGLNIKQFQKKAGRTGREKALRQPDSRLTKKSNIFAAYDIDVFSTAS